MSISDTITGCGLVVTADPRAAEHADAQGQIPPPPSQRAFGNRDGRFEPTRSGLERAGSGVWAEATTAAAYAPPA